VSARKHEAIYLARRSLLRCNGALFTEPQEVQPMTKTRRRSITHFEATSVLFFALATGCAFSARAQAPDTQIPASKPKWSPQQIDQAFKLADSNGDGQISRDEAQRFAAVLKRFDQVDVDKDGLISRAEWDAALKA
jgi:hypothetical protein